jgi:hypothetical protein
LSKSFVFSPADAPSTINATHVKVPGFGNYDVTFKFNPTTLAFDMAMAIPSVTDVTTESFAGWYVCTLFDGTVPIMSPMIRPVGNDLLVGGVFQYKYIGISGTTEAPVWKYTVSFADGTRYFLSMSKGAASTGTETPITAIMGYLDAGKTDLDLANTRKCTKKG